MRLSFLVLSLGVLLTEPALAQTRSYCCVDSDGRQQCGNVLPASCYGKAYRELDSKGRTIKRHEAALTPEQKVQREKELALKKEMERQALEETRRNRALLNTYASEKDIDAALEKALVELEKSVKAARDKLTEATKRKDKLMGEAEFYKKKGMPPELKRQIQDNESEIKAKEKELQAREQEREDIRKRFEDEKQRYRDLTKGKARTLPPGMAGNP